MKKMTGDDAELHYRVIDADGVVHQLLPEFCQPSLKPAIGKGWFESFKSDVYPDDFVVMRGARMKPPRYYDRLHESSAPVAHEKIKAARVRYGRAHAADATPQRLATRKKVVEAKISTLKRTVE